MYTSITIKRYIKHQSLHLNRIDSYPVAAVVEHRQPLSEGRLFRGIQGLSGRQETAFKLSRKLILALKTVFDLKW